MKIIEQSVELIDDINGEEILKKLELCGRVCYKSEDRITDDSAKEFIRKIIKRGHESVLEHVNITIKWITNRGVTHELVRHRLASYSQESTRYVKYDNNMEFINPIWFKETNNHCKEKWELTMYDLEMRYNELLNKGWTPQQARSILPNSLKTEIIFTMNLRELRLMLKLRTSKAAHPQIRDIAIKTLELLKNKLPVVFDDINYKEIY